MDFRLLFRNVSIKRQTDEVDVDVIVDWFSCIVL